MNIPVYKSMSKNVIKFFNIFTSPYFTGPLALCICLSMASFAHAQSSNDPSNAYNCTNVALDEIAPALLTKEERIALLDNSLSESIDNYSVCVNEVAASMSGGGSGSGSSSASGGGSQGSADGNSQEAGENTVNEETMPETIPTTSPTQVNRGVIPPKDNDKTICKLLFQEIQGATDSVMLTGLRKQYADYKCGK